MKTKNTLMQWNVLALFLGAALAMGCGGDDDPPPAALAPPLALDVGTIDLSCLNTASEDVPYANSFTLTGVTYELGVAGDPAIADASITVYSGTDFGTALTTQTANGDGEFEVTIPAGETRISYKLEADDHLATFSLGNYYSDTADAKDDVPGASLTIANALPSFVQVTRTPGTGVLAGTALDCNGKPVMNAFATVSTTSGSDDPVDGALVFYVNTVPVTTLSSTNRSGEFAILEIPDSSTNVYIQVWGYLTQADADADEKTLIGEVATPVLADSVITAGVDVLRD